MKGNKFNATEIIKVVYLFISFFAVDALIRIMTRWLGYYSIYKIAPSLFSLCWICIIIVSLSLFPRKVGRIIYIIFYAILAIYSIIQYIYYLIFDKFLFFSDLQNASEGGEFLEYAFDVIDKTSVIYIIVFLLIGIMGWMFYPKFSRKKKSYVVRGNMLIISCLGIAFIPQIYKLDTNAAMNSYVEYRSFTSSGFDLEICGYYQFLVRDIWMSYLKPVSDSSAYVTKVDNYLSKKKVHKKNQYTDFLKDKNVILVQMESIDDWIINEENMPTVSKMMKEGINFTNMYTVCYGSGLTFGTEFAFNSGVYQGTKTMSGARLARNHFPYSIGNIAKTLGYTCNSFHENTGNYYNRVSMHDALGYTYHSTAELLTEGDPKDDTTIVSNNVVWDLLMNKGKESKFFDFIITFSPHLPYNLDDELSRYALQKYPEYNNKERNLEINSIYAKARLTDDMFSIMLKRLEEENKLNDTVIIAYSDHYSYGLTNQEEVLEYSKKNGSDILERTPAFIWYKGCEALEINKVCQTIDWLPTISNMLGVDVTPYVLGNDIFDDSYEGYAFFPDNSWISDKTYVRNGVIKVQGNMSKVDIEKMNHKIQMFYAANDAILRSDYYNNIEINGVCSRD